MTTRLASDRLRSAYVYMHDVGKHSQALSDANNEATSIELHSLDPALYSRANDCVTRVYEAIDRACAELEELTGEAMRTEAKVTADTNDDNAERDREWEKNR